MNFDIFSLFFSSKYFIFPFGFPCVCAQSLNHVWVFATPWTVAYQASLSMEFSRQEYQNGLPFPTSEDLPNLGIEPTSPESLIGRQILLTVPPGKPFSFDSKVI